MKITGEQFINAICNRLSFEKELCYDGHIITRIMKLTSQDLHQLVDLGNVQAWHNEALQTEEER